MIATAISKAIKAYSIEAVPRSSQMNLRRREFIAGPLKRSGNSSGGGPGVTPEPPSQDGLLQLVRNRRERAGQLRAERRHGADGGDRDERGDEAILDGGGARLVVGETVEKALHVSSFDLVASLPSVDLRLTGPIGTEVDHNAGPLRHS